ncbi:MAG: protein BatD [Candidatus Marinimicrobia bacterium]|nr:protein BatD [Candidatus Neomarinimicrobiota bacterium]
MKKIGSLTLGRTSVVVLLLMFWGRVAAQPKISASIDTKQILVQESFTWKLEVEGSDEMPEVRLPDIKKVALLSGPMQSSNYTYVNGKMSSKKSISYTFVAMEAGKAVIPAIEVILGNQRYFTEALRFEIISKGAKGTPVASSSESVFLRAIPSKTNVYLGEPLTVSYKLFTKVGVYNYQVEKLPDAVGFWAEEIPQTTQPRLVSEVIDGVRYNTAILKTVLYYPTRSGELLIDPIQSELEIEVKSTQRGQSRFNDPFFNDPFFNGSRKATKNFLSNPLKIKVKELPEPRPENFSGAVGSFQLKAGLDTNAVFANDAVGLSINLSGSGNFKALQLPEPKLPDGIDIFKPERTESISIKNMRHSGSKKSTYLLVPRNSGEVLIDPIEFTYFDLRANKYITKSSGWIRMTVYDAEGSQPVVTSGYSREEVALMQEDIRYIKAADSRFSAGSAPVFGMGFWAIHLLGIVSLLAVFAYEYRSQQLQGNVSLRRRANALNAARRRLKQAEKLSEDSPELRALLHQCITGFIGARLDVAENTLDTSEFSDLMAKRGTDTVIASETRLFLEGLAMDRFAPGVVQRSAGEWMLATRNLLQKLRRVL